MSDPRWTQDVEDLVADELGADIYFGPDRYDAVRRILTALANAGLLVAAGGKTRTVWGIGWTQPPTALDAGSLRYADFIGDDEDYDEDEGGEASARECVEWHQTNPAGNRGVHLARHAVHTGPWQEVPS